MAAVGVAVSGHIHRDGHTTYSKRDCDLYIHIISRKEIYPQEQVDDLEQQLHY